MCNDRPDQAYEDVKLDLHRNRAHIRLSLGRYEGAIADAQASLILKSDTTNKGIDAKAYFRAGRASYKLKLFDQAVSFFRRQLELEPAERDGLQELSKTEARLHEEATGVYDLATIITKLTPENPRVDTANFTVNTVIKASAGRGRGLFATRSLNIGDLIMAETAFCGVWGHEKAGAMSLKWDARSPQRIVPSQVGLWRKIVHQMRHNPETSRALLDLQGGYGGIGKDTIKDDDGLAVIDTFQVYDLVVRNQFGLDATLEQAQQGIPAGVFTRASYLNHCCVPNAKRHNVGDLLLLYALKPISEGEEINISYDDPVGDYDFRTEVIRDKWEFSCDCQLCEVEAQVPAALRAKRTALLQDSYKLMRSYPASSRTSDRIIVKAEQLIRAIADTYDSRLYLGLPRIAMIDIQNWLVQVYEEKHDVRSTEAAIAFFSTVGYYVDRQGRRLTHIAPTNNSISSHVATAFLAPLKRAASAARSSGDTQTADGLSKAERDIESALMIGVADTKA